MKMILTLAAICISAGCYCQKGDYLVKNNGDTIWGDIKLKHFIFYVSGSTPAEVSADDVTAVKSDKYKGNTVVHCNLQLYTDNLTSLDLDYIYKGTLDTVLVLNEIYATPKINLYFARSDFRVPFYFYKTPANPRPVQLVTHYYLQGGLTNYRNNPGRFSGNKSKLQLAEDRAFVNQLYNIMGDCKNITETMWEMLEYRDYSLKKLIKRYNKCN